MGENFIHDPDHQILPPMGAEFNLRPRYRVGSPWPWQRETDPFFIRPINVLDESLVFLLYTFFAVHVCARGRDALLFSQQKKDKTTEFSLVVGGSKQFKSEIVCFIRYIQQPSNPVVGWSFLRQYLPRYRRRFVLGFDTPPEKNFPTLVFYQK